MSIITLTTDFGLQSPYVGLMKGVILGIAPDATLVDITHEIPPHDVTATAMVLDSLWGYFPDGTIHLVVVDPGVGTQRKPVAVQTERYFWICPDNGVLTKVLDRTKFKAGVSLNNDRYHRRPVSDTFHGRDIFAPGAGHLASGVPIEQLGDPINDMVRIDLPQPEETQNGLLLHVVHVDRFGNLVTDLTRDQLTQWVGGESDTLLELRATDTTTIQKINLTYGDVGVGEWVMYFGSGGYLEVGIRNGNAAQTIGLPNARTTLHLKRRSAGPL